VKFSKGGGDLVTRDPDAMWLLARDVWWVVPFVCPFPLPQYPTLNKMFPSGPPTEQEIFKIARRTTDIIQSNITSDVCLFGSAASALWADIDRVPHVRRITLALSIPTLF
jgi:hypothetical protein